MGFICFLVFTAIWYLPLFLKHRKISTEPAKYYVKALLLGFAAALVTTVIELGVLAIFSIAKFAPAVNVGTSEHLVFRLFYVLIAIALVEELSKMIGGKITVKRLPELTEAGWMLFFGMVGIGFELKETLFNATDIISGCLRGITELHVFNQLWMGKFLWRAMQAKKVDDNAAYKKMYASPSFLRLSYIGSSISAS